MSPNLLPILKNPAVAERVSSATRRVLEERADAVAHVRYLDETNYLTLQSIIAALLPQGTVGTDVDVADAIDKRLAEHKGDGWRFADLPAHGEAYQRGLTAFAAMLSQTSSQSFERMATPAREEYLRSVAKGDLDEPAGFALSKWLLMLKTDAVRQWMSHPSVMERLEYFGFADGATGTTNGPTALEGWQAITTNTALPFEKGAVTHGEAG